MRAFARLKSRTAPGAVDVHPPTLLAANCADRQRTRRRSQRDDAMRLRLRHLRDLMIDRDHSREGEIGRYTEAGQSAG